MLYFDPIISPHFDQLLTYGPVSVFPVYQQSEDNHFRENSFNIIEDEGVKAVVKTFHQRGRFGYGWWNYDGVNKTLGGVLLSSSLPLNDTNAALFAKGSMINHGCADAVNVSYTWNREEGVSIVRAKRAIDVMEELLLSYCRTQDVGDVFDRSRITLETCGFFCMCPQCVREQAQVEERGNAVLVRS